MLDLTELTALNDEDFAAMYSELKKEHKRRLALQDVKRERKKLYKISTKLTAVLCSIENLNKNLDHGPYNDDELILVKRQRLLNKLQIDAIGIAGYTKELMNCYGVDFDED